MSDAVFVIPSVNLLQGAIDTIDKLFVPSRNQDTLGDIYEYLLSEIAEAGKNGQFRTPRHIIRVMCDLLNPQFNERICDPACGTSGFLVNAYQHILKSYTSTNMLEFEADGSPSNLIGDLLDAQQHEELRRNHLYGFDFDRTMIRLGWMNMILHGLENPSINYYDTLGSRFNEQITSGKIGDFDVILANPPFTGNIDKNDIGESLQWLNTNKTELLFLELILQLLHTGGRAAVIVPEGVLFGSSGAHRALRKKLVTENQLNAIISLPGGVFQPYTFVKTSILVFTKGGITEHIWFYEVESDGFGLNAKRTDQPNKNDLWDMILKYRLRYAKAFSQPIPAFVDSLTWQKWLAMNSNERSYHYAQPIIDLEIRQDTEADSTNKTPLNSLETVKVNLFKGFETVRLDRAKDWETSIDSLIANEYNLSAGRYKPLATIETNYDQPTQIIQELHELEYKIQKDLETLLAMLEVKE